MRDPKQRLNSRTTEKRTLRSDAQALRPRPSSAAIRLSLRIVVNNRSGWSLLQEHNSHIGPPVHVSRAVGHCVVSAAA